MYDVIIIGGGPAGLSAALTLGRTRRDVLVLDSGHYRNAPAATMHNFISRDGTPPAEMRRIAREQLGAYPSVEVRDLEAIDARALEEGGFEISLPDSEVVLGRRLVLATGLVDELPPIEGMASLWGQGVFHCPYCHGYEVRDTPLAVLGATSRAVHLSMLVRRLSDDVVLCTDGAAGPEASTDATLASQGVTVREKRIARLEGKDGHLDRIVSEDGTALERHGLFCGTATTRQRSGLPARLGCSLFEDDCVVVDEFGKSSVAGVYAVGDMARRASLPAPLSTVIVAAASGSIAGSAVDRELLADDIAGHQPTLPSGR